MEVGTAYPVLVFVAKDTTDADVSAGSHRHTV
ncbi:MAG: hypothetical protein J07HB67_01451 [halophilic archaeon J07HB67]|nr:MAG: hypothetical protein J07HB67_01451 [halophilic archaeon J07HB67]